MFAQMNLLDLPSAISSPESVSGALPSVPPESRMTRLYGREAVPANLSARQAKEMGWMTSGTSGQPGSTSSASAALCESLVSRLQVRTRALGSTLYTMTWKPWVTPSGRSRFRLRASVLRTSVTGSIGLPLPVSPRVTPAARDWKDTAGMATTGTNPDGSERSRLDQLPRQAALAGWPTPGALIIEAKPKPPIMGNRKPTDPQIGLADVAVHLAGWPSPTTPSGGQTPPDGTSPTGRTPDGRKVQVTLKDLASLAAWPTPQAHDTRKRGNTNADHHNYPHDLPNMAEWCDQPARLTVTGQLLTGSIAGMESGGQLNPEHSRWLMGCPAVWGLCHPNYSDWRKWQDFLALHSKAPRPTASAD